MYSILGMLYCFIFILNLIYMKKFPLFFFLKKENGWVRATLLMAVARCLPTLHNGRKYIYSKQPNGEYNYYHGCYTATAEWGI